MQKALSIVFTFLICLSANGQKYFELSAEVTSAYDDIIHLRLNDAEHKIEIYKSSSPDNVLIHLFDNYIDFFRIFINEDKAEFKRLEKNKKIRLRAIKKGDIESPYYLYSQAEIYLQWALARLKFEQYLTAFTEVSKAFQLLEYNEKKFPDFIANKKSLGILHALVGTIPDNYRWGAKLLGMSGTVNQGKEEIRQVLNYAKENDFLFEEETITIYAFVLLHLAKEEEGAWNILQSEKLNHKKSPLAAFVKSSIALRSGKNDNAIDILKNRPVGHQYSPIYFLDYQLGLAMLHKLDPSAKIYFESYIRNHSGSNYKKDAYLKLAWCDLLFSGGKQYFNYLEQCAAFEHQQIDEDKSAHRMAIELYRPNPNLLKARLLFDGGYYDRALEVLESNAREILRNPLNKLEYLYRKARIFHKMKQFDLALQSYSKILLMPNASDSYMVANAALQSGYIYTELGQKSMAKAMFKKCLSLSPSQYRTSMHQKAKAGLSGLED